MPTDYYSDASETEAAVSRPTEAKSAETFLLPKAALGGTEFEKGATVTFTLVADHGEEIEVAPAGEETTTEEAPPAVPEEAPSAGMDPMSGMME